MTDDEVPRKPVSHYIKLLFPYGTLPVSVTTDADAPPSWAQMPEWPPDVFAAAAYLVDTSGAYQYLQYNPSTQRNGDPFAVYGANRRRLEVLGAAWAFQLFDGGGWTTERRRKEAEAAVRVFGGSIADLTSKELLECQKLELQELWTKLVNANDQPLVLRPQELPEASGTPPGWWRHAMQMLILSDQASRGIGFCLGDKKSSWTQQQHFELVAAKDAGENSANGSRPSMRISTLLSHKVDRNLVNVLPKCRTPSVGWTLRSLTHHLAFIAPQGKLGTVWHMSVSRPPPAANPLNAGDKAPDVGRPLNLLVVPFPYTIRAECFKPKGDLNDRRHAEFSVDPLWLTDEAGKGGVRPHKLSSFIEELCEVACHEDQYVNGIILPEQALDQATFYRIANNLADHEHLGEEFEFIMSGLHRIRTTNGQDLSGVNYVGVRGKLFRGRNDTRRSKEAKDPWHWDGKWDYKAYRGKHHRWKLDPRQISRYGLTHRLGADKQAWWEGIGIRQRVIDVFTPRHGATMTALICEDLARNDPCLDVIRAIGPNLVVALLMDGPQTSYRWPAHYAGVLAEDPGCSVLTVTNFGMVARSSVRDTSRSRSVAFWKDSVGNQLELQLPEGFHALLLSLRGVASEEKTLDGRRDGGSTYRWELASVMPLRASKGLSD